VTINNAGGIMPAKSEKQRKLFGAVLRCKKTGECASKGIEKIAKGISTEDARDFARKPKKKHLKEQYTFVYFLKMSESSEM
jgi:hypothetical protein